MNGPVAARLRRQMELNNRNGQAVDYTLLLPIEVHLGQHHAPHLVYDPHQLTPSPVETALLWQDGKLSRHYRRLRRQAWPASARLSHSRGH